MATPPTFILDNEGAEGWGSSAHPHTTATFNSAIGDVWVTGLVAENNPQTWNAPTNGGTAQTYTARGSVDATDYTEVRTWTTVVANTLTGQSVAIDRTSGGVALKWNLSVVRFSGSSGIGAVPAGEAETDNTAPSLSITTTGDNSAIVVFIGDWDAIDGASRTWRTVNSVTPTAGNGYELTYFRDSAAYTTYVGYYPDAGAAGAKTVGLTAPTTGKMSIVAVEVLGSAATNATVSATTIATAAAQPAPAKQTGSTVAATAIVTAATLPAPAVQTGSTLTVAAIAAVAALPAPTITAVTVVAANAIVTTIALPPPAIQTGSTVAATSIAAVAALSAPTVIAATVISPVSVAATTALPAPTLQTGSTVTATAVATTTAIPIPTVDTGGIGTYTNHVTIAAPKTGGTTHTVHPDGTGGTAVDGSTFTPTAGRFLLCLVEGGVTSTTPTGWTLPSNGSAINNTGLYVFYRSSASGDSGDQVATTHNASDYQVVFDFYEFTAGTSWGSAVSATGVSNGGAGPDLTGLSGTNWVAGVLGASHAGGVTSTTTWDNGTEEVDHCALTDVTDGYSYSLAYTAGFTGSSAQWAATQTVPPAAGGAERLMLAIDAAAGGATDATVSAVAIATAAALPAPAIQTGSTVASSAVAAVVAMPAPSFSTGSTVSVTAVAAVAALPAPSVSTGSNATVTPAAVAAVVDIPGVEQADATVAPDAVAVVAAVGVPSVQTAGNATVSATAIVTVAALPAPAIQVGSTVSATTISTVAVLPAPSIQTAGNVTIAATAIAVVVAVPAPALQTGQRVNPAAVATVTDLPAPTVSGNITVTPAAIAAVTALPAPSVSTGSMVSVTVVATVVAFPASTVTGNVAEGITGNAYPAANRAAIGNAYPRSGGGIIGSVA